MSKEVHPNLDSDQTPASTVHSNDGPAADTAEPRSAIELLKLIKSQEFDPKSLSPDDRRVCVVHLQGEGLSSSEIAHWLRCHERTIERDRRAIREANALKRDPGFADRVAGEFLVEAEQTVFRIRRAARDAAATPGDRITAEKSCFDIRCNVIDRLQSLGYLPSALRRTELTFRADENGPSNVDLSLEVSQLVAVVRQDPGLSGLVPELEALQALSDKALLAERVADVKLQLLDTSSHPPAAERPKSPCA